ncbi:DUF922 domain-containing Zn-dependent protease [Pseudoflavitalea sp. G-6-1-2]|uniref:DUF922 domain-containing protein n=1 Tax=Pseudoflavitalea sp. G-6-1-2 TaxID=2728841 RepID=UPI00146ADF68|nr:DUF922 domain-containing protein [Pseudoflavitalea sp. G-6-1-2]NML20675.1 DUF922 domain-containing Zn-dependent protease [Pseudoflavitalea sp. G-6-1-2]
MHTFFLIVLLSLHPVPQQVSSIPWNESRKLTWTDFLAKPDPVSGNAAMTNSVINIEFNIDDTSLDYTISCRFDKNRSWVKVRTAPVLQHEQGHFDIAEIYARKLNKEMKALSFNAATIKNDVNVIYDKIMAVYQQVQHQYDQETDFSRNKPKQAEWLAKIAADIKSLEAHAGYATTQVISQKSALKK